MDASDGSPSVVEANQRIAPLSILAPKGVFCTCPIGLSYDPEGILKFIETPLKVRENATSVILKQIQFMEYTPSWSSNIRCNVFGAGTKRK